MAQPVQAGQSFQH